jgi:DNA helicase-2/ATP-dependent DNA helicase PcrA
VNFTMFGDPRLRAWHEHRIQLVSSDNALREAVSLVTRTRAGKRRTWRVETSRKDYDKGLEFAHSLCPEPDMEVVRRARLTSMKSFAFMPASHVRPGMLVPILRGDKVEEARVTSVGLRPYRGPVYDLAVRDLRNYAASGLLVHNSVYRWRGADLRNIMDFEKDFPDCRVIPLEQNYRSTKRILSIADAVIQHNLGRKDKRLWTDNAEGDRALAYRAWDETEEAAYVARGIQHLHDRGVNYRDTAVFYRTNAQSRVLEDALRRGSIPYVIVGGVRFYDRREVKDVVAYLRLMVNPLDDVAFRRAVAAPSRGIGRATLDRLAEVARREGRPLLDVAGAPPADVTGKPRRSLEEFVRLVASLGAEQATTPVPALIDAVLAGSGYREALKAERNAESEARLANLELVAEPHRCDALDRAAVDVRPIGAAAVFDEPRPAPERQHSVLRRRERVLDHDAVVDVASQRGDRVEREDRSDRRIRRR